MIWWLENKKIIHFLQFIETLSFYSYLVANRFVNKLSYGKTREINAVTICALRNDEFNLSALLQSAQISAPKSSVTFTVSFLQLSFHHPSFHEWYVSFIDLRVEFSEGYMYISWFTIFFSLLVSRWREVYCF